MAREKFQGNIQFQESRKVMHISGLSHGRARQIVSDVFFRLATRDWEKKHGLKVTNHHPDYRNPAQLESNREILQSELAEGGYSVVMGSSAGAQEALRLGHQHNAVEETKILVIANQGRLARGGTDDHPTLDEAAAHHEGFKKAVETFEDVLRPSIESSVATGTLYTTIGANRDSVVPRNLKKLKNIRHREIRILQLLPRSLTHGVAIYKGLRIVPEIIKSATG